MKIFKNRQSAGQILARRLKNVRADLVLGIPRGGVVVAYQVAKELNLFLDILVTRKIGAPNQPELALGAVDGDGSVVWDQELLTQLKLKIESVNLAEKIEDERNEISRREKIYRQGRLPLDVKNKTIILTDDGIATGSTTLAAINYLRRHQAGKVILAVPVASKEAKNKIIREFGEFGGFGEIIILETPEDFQAVGQFYHQFEPVEDEKVITLLERASSSQ